MKKKIFFFIDQIVIAIILSIIKIIISDQMCTHQNVNNKNKWK